MRTNETGSIVVLGFALLAGLAIARPAWAQDAATAYPKMAPDQQYRMSRTAEIALARSAAPESISGDATVLILGRHGYHTAVPGKNGFVCFVGRSWLAAFDWAEFWNPKIRAADCLNPEAARSIVPILDLRSRMVMAGRSKAEIVAALKAAYAKQQLPQLPGGAMDYMMSKSSYLTDQGGHNLPHLMFYTRLGNAEDWGSGAAGSPVMSSPYWFVSPGQQSRMQQLPQILVFLVGTATWSDGSPVARQQ
ncbi:MAG TPA: hypothetical protein VGG42_02970 [Acidobacteriaceae bacterium]|jgi:hypothetical protein